MELEINEFKKNNIINEKISYFLFEHYNLNKLLKIIEFIIIFTFFNILLISNNLKIYSLGIYRHYTNDCRKLKRYNRNPIKKRFPYISICIPAYNMENYIGKVILSILNQSFQDFEIIVVNDFSLDNTKNIIQSWKLKDDRIKLINHSKNLGVYNSRVDAILSSKGKYILLMDPDDMLINPNILKELYKYNTKYNLDIIEFTVMRYHEIKDYLFLKEKKNHDHQLENKIIYQPKLSDIFFYYPGSNNYSMVQCRNIWNKFIRRIIVLNTILYIGKKNYKMHFITAEDTMINLISLHFAQNYTNIYLPGYMYSIRKVSMTHGKKKKKNKIFFYYNHLLYLKQLYIYIKDFNKDRNFLYYELIEINKQLLKLNKFSNKYKKEILEFYKQVLNDTFISKKFKEDLKNTINIVINAKYILK